ncbi:MAG: FecR domain-containing protein [Lachnospiraceae bacterium]|nr:FecR domain-containing protein [Lachnospiraceae bacterium]
MSAGDFIKTTKGKIITIGGTAVVAVGIAAALLLQGEGYRSIAVQEVAGNVTVVGEKNNGQAYVGEHLYSGDDVTVGDASELTMCMDNDKYVYADANTHFSLQASAANEDSKIKIYLDAGSELNDLQTSLAAGESYEVDTPNSTMSVRGTKFRVTVYKGKDGNIYTLTEVTDGQVLIKLKTTTGEYNGVEKLFKPGQSTLIRGNSNLSEFVTSEMLNDADLSGDSGDIEVLMLSYDTLPTGGLDRLMALLENGNVDGSGTDTDSEEKTEETKTVDKSDDTQTPEANIEDEADAGEGGEPTPINSLRSAVKQQRINSAVVGTDPETGGLILKDGTIFDPDYYAKANPDVVKNFGGDTNSLLNHYLTFGKNENRPASLKDALAKEEAFKQFANALDEAYRQEMEAKNASSSPGSGSSGTGGGGIVRGAPGTFDSLNIGANGYATRLNNASNTPATVTNYNNTDVTRNRISIDEPNATVTVPISLTDSANNATFNAPLPSNIDWANTANGVTVTYTNSNATMYEVKKNSANSYEYTATDPTGIVVGSGTGTDPYAFRTSLENLGI